MQDPESEKCLKGLLDRQKEVDSCLLQIAPRLIGKEPTKPPATEEEDDDEEETDPETETSSQVDTSSSQQKVDHLGG